MTATTDKITGFFDKLGWMYRVVDGGKVITTYRCPVPAFYYVIAIEVISNRHWTTVRALLQRDIHGGNLDPVLRLISQWNEVIYRAKFLLVGDCVIIQAEEPASRLTFDLFVEALSAICRYSTLAGVEIAAVATNPSVNDQVRSVVEVTKPHTWDESIEREEFDLDFDISMNRIPD